MVGKDKTLSDYMASSIETMAGPQGNPTRVLRMQNKADDPDQSSTSRNEYSFFMKAPPDEYREGYVKYWMKLQSNLADLLPNDKRTPWYMIMEWKEPDSGAGDPPRECRACGEEAGGSNNYRINIGIHREPAPRSSAGISRGAPTALPEDGMDVFNPELEVPLGRWFLVEAYMKKHATRAGSISR